jgi:hypothetical protein
MGCSRLCLPVGLITQSQADTSDGQHPAIDCFESADFALIRIRKWLTPQSFYRSNAPHGQSPTRRYITGISEDLSSGPVIVVCSEFDIRHGHLLDGSAMFMDRTGFFNTKKINLQDPLGKTL